MDAKLEQTKVETPKKNPFIYAKDLFTIRKSTPISLVDVLSIISVLSIAAIMIFIT